MKKHSCFNHKHAFPWIFPVIFPICFPILFMAIFGGSKMGWWHHQSCQKNQVQTQQVENSQNKALETLKIRYANGEINKEEYEQIKKDLDN